MTLHPLTEKDTVSLWVFFFLNQEIRKEPYFTDLTVKQDTKLRYLSFLALLILFLSR